MKETLRALVELQELEDSLRDLHNLKETLVKATQDNEETRALFRAMLSEREGQLEEARSFCKEKEDEIKEVDEGARRSRGRFNQIQSQRELTALNKELDSARRRSQQRNEELTKLKTQLDTATEDYNQKVAEFQALEEDMERTEAELENRVREGEADASRGRRADASEMTRRLCSTFHARRAARPHSCLSGRL